jgi:hypothetical protein
MDKSEGLGDSWTLCGLLRGESPLFSGHTPVVSHIGVDVVPRVAGGVIVGSQGSTERAKPVGREATPFP